MTKENDTITFATGSISAQCFYTTQEVKSILGISDFILSKWKTKGLTYNKIGNNYVFEGRDIQRYLRENKIKKVAE